ncbi:hypothetical protein PRZ48_000996 [Zasmidium cellare]|uniref:RING-type domain-containing protein n=1 Tax=Zasmidium cellare TaxID=395010 RepID=A0ABR0F1P1_ZASCE|nr:hypothetical protein PRZ48_000996 [Zasmidium cellare]
MASCSVCLESITSDTNKRHITGLIPHTNTRISDDVCEPCVQDSIIPKFHDAIHKEALYPVRWGSMALNPSQFLDLLGQDFLDRFARKEEEYACARDRLYCPHKIEVSKAPLPGGIATTQLALKEAQITSQGLEVESCGGFISRRRRKPSLTTCPRCLGILCHSCGLELSTITTKHTCPSTLRDNPLRSLTRGRDYQKCPSCARTWQLRDGCNSLRCICGTSLCFVCGRRVPEHESQHWREGSKCPRFNQPGATNALFDERWAPRAEDVEEQEFVLPRDIPAGRIVEVEEGLQEFFVGLREVQAGVRQVLVRGRKVPAWVEEWGLVDVEAVFELRPLLGPRFVRLAPTSARAERQRELRGRVEASMRRFFRGWDELVRNLLRILLPVGFDQLPRGDGLGELEDGEKDEEGDDIAEAEEDIHPVAFPPIFIAAADPSMRFDYSITVDLLQLVQTYKEYHKAQDQRLAELNPLLKGGVSGSVEISFSGDVDEPWIDWAYIEGMVLEDGEEEQIEGLREQLNEQMEVLAELVQMMVS